MNRFQFFKLAAHASDVLDIDGGLKMLGVLLYGLRALWDISHAFLTCTETLKQPIALLRKRPFIRAVCLLPYVLRTCTINA